MKSIFEYMNCREYLRDLFEEKKRKAPFYSYRIFSQKAGFKSPNFLKLVIDGKRNFSKESAFRFSKGLGHNKKEAEYFENLVFFNQSKTLEEKTAYLSKLMKHRKKSDPKRIEESEYKYYTAWYNPVILELATAVDFKNDFRELGRMMLPAIRAEEAKKSVELLLNLGFIRKGVDGTYVKASPSLSTGPQVRSVAIANYHRSMIGLGSESLDRFGAVERDITALTLSVSQDTQRVITAKLQQLRRELLEMEEADRNPDRVVQLNFQLFPVSELFNEGEGEQ